MKIRSQLSSALPPRSRLNHFSARIAARAYHRGTHTLQQVIIIACLLPCGTCNLQAAFFAAQVVNYVPGTNATATNPQAAVGQPSPGVPGFAPYTNAETLNPFNPHYAQDELVQIGPGGSLTLRLERFVHVGVGAELGVFGNVGLIDAGTNQAGNPAVGFGIDQVRIEVSETGLSGEWVALNEAQRVTINNPTSFFTDDNGFTGPTANVADLLPLLDNFTHSDFGKPFTNPTGDLAAYNDLDLSQITNLFNGSAGGNWLDLGGLTIAEQPLQRVGYVRFSDPFDPDPNFGQSDLFELVALSINTMLAGAPIPEPTSGLLLLAGLGFGVRRRK